MADVLAVRDDYRSQTWTMLIQEWTTNADGTISRTVTKKCKYCGYQENVTQLQVKLTYDANGGKGAIDPATGAAGESVTVAENVFTRSNCSGRAEIATAGRKK